MKKIGLYIHIPFCKRKCFYCHFLKYTYDAELAGQYVTALTEEIRLRSGSPYIIETLYWGGGSPALLSEKQTASIMETLRENFDFTPTCEITLEMNPEDVNREKLKTLKKQGVNRLSLGIQSFAAVDLTYLKRSHSREQSLSAVTEAQNAGFTSLSLDFIISLPNQDKKNLEQNFSIAQEFKIPHISAYILEGMEEKDISKKEQRDHDYYYFCRDFLEASGCSQYEVSNFSRGKKKRSKHNLKYWQNEEYMGLGLGASGYEDGVDYRNTPVFKDYFTDLAAGRLPRRETGKTDPRKRRIVMGLRLLEGIPTSNFKHYPQQLELLLNNGMLSERSGKIAVPPEKILLLNEILGYFI